MLINNKYNNKTVLKKNDKDYLIMGKIYKIQIINDGNISNCIILKTETSAKFFTIIINIHNWWIIKI